LNGQPLFAATPLPTSSQFCHHTLASFQKAAILGASFERAASSAATLLHPEQAAILQGGSFAVTLFYILQTSRQFCCHTFASPRASSHFCCHTLHPSNQQPVLLPTSLHMRPVAAHISSNKLPALPLHLCIFVPEATPATDAQVVTMDHCCKFMTDLLTS
jgi:hypothetical protein